MAGLGVVITVFLTNVERVLLSLTEGCAEVVAVGALVLLTFSSLIYTLSWLVLAISPRSDSTPAMNRFAWPTLAKVQPEQLYRHTFGNTARDDAWKQVIDLSALAARKFRASSRAMWGFAVFLLLALLTIFVATAITMEASLSG